MPNVSKNTREKLLFYIFVLPLIFFYLLLNLLLFFSQKNNCFDELDVRWKIIANAVRFAFDLRCFFWKAAKGFLYMKICYCLTYSTITHKSLEKIFLDAKLDAANVEA